MLRHYTSVFCDTDLARDAQAGGLASVTSLGKRRRFSYAVPVSLTKGAFPEGDYAAVDKDSRMGISA
jgi:hypothetical protein